MSDILKAPFPYFGGKSRIAAPISIAASMRSRKKLFVVRLVLVASVPYLSSVCST